MSSYVFDTVKIRIARGEITFYNIPDGGYRLALVTSAAFANMSTGALSDKVTWEDVKHTEITQDVNYNSEGYNGHQKLKNIGLYEEDVDGFTQLKISATDISFPISTINADGAIIYKDDSHLTLIEAIDFGGKISSNNGVFLLELATKGWLRIH